MWLCAGRFKGLVQVLCKSLVRGLVRTSCAPVEKRLFGTACALIAVHKTFCGTVLVRVLCASWVLREVVLCDLVREFFMVDFFSVRYSSQKACKACIVKLSHGET